MKRILSINFADRLNDLRRPDHWGEFCDAFSIATIYSVQMKVAIVESPTNLKIKSVQEIKGYRTDGKRLARSRVAQKYLVFFQRHSRIAIAN